MNSEKAQALMSGIESSISTLAAETDAFRQSDGFKAILRTMTRFHKYSFSNQLLIATQRAVT